MTLHEDMLFKAVVARDYRFDGKFVVAVKTTGIYCRPICPAKPRRENVEFFATARAAERAGYRPCLRCRPECAPEAGGARAWQAGSELVRRGLQRIAANEWNGTGEEALANRLGVSTRHLRRVFVEELGQTPKQVANAHRLNFARKLVVETRLPVMRIALASGFGSLRRFNDAFVKRFARTPSALRKGRRRGDPAPNDTPIELTLAYRPPYDWNAIHAFFAAHEVPGLERIGDGYYERLFHIEGRTGIMTLVPHASKPALVMRVITADPAGLLDLTHRVRRMFDLDADPLLVANGFAEVPVMRTLAEKHPGLRIPRCFDPFETAVCAILGQLVSLEYARTLAGQLVAHHGESAPHPVTGEPMRLFPTPERLAAADLPRVKTTRARKEAIRLFSRRVLAGEISLSEAQDPEAFRAALLAIPGIGPWTAQYMSLRCIADTDAFPATDLILKRALELHPAIDLTPIKPWRGYAAIYLWKEYAQSLSKRKERA
jgi:AraC family transcriptional regulator of adaptative response / DNA-3-methyladenine glycosylase II